MLQVAHSQWTGRTEDNHNKKGMSKSSRKAAQSTDNPLVFSIARMDTNIHRSRGHSSDLVLFCLELCEGWLFCRLASETFLR